MQADTLTLPVPDSGVFLSTNISADPATPDDLPELERDEFDDLQSPELEDKSKIELTNELDQTIEDCRNHLQNIEESIETSDSRAFLVGLVKC